MMVYVAASAPELRALVPEYRLRTDIAVFTSDRDTVARIRGLLIPAERVRLVGDWRRGRYADEVARQLDMRLMRSGARLSHCRRIGNLWNRDTASPRA